MPESIEVRARTKEEAIRQALDELGVSREDVEVEVLEEGRSGVFGVGSQDARIRVTVLEDYPEDEDEEDEAVGNQRDYAEEEEFADEDEEEDEEYEEEEGEAEL